MNKTDLTRAIKYTSEGMIISILLILGEESNITQNSLDNQEKLSTNDIEIIRETILILIEKDDKFFEKIAYIWENGVNRSFDKTKVMIVGIIVLGSIANNLIISQNPTKETTQIDGNKTTKEIYRDYGTIADSIKALAEITSNITK